MAGVSTKDIKQRIRSMESTRQITRAMEMVAASKLRKAQDRVLNSRPYFQQLYATISHIAATKPGIRTPYLKDTGGSRVCCVVIAGDRGLAGGYNSNVFKLVLREMEGFDYCVLPIGKKAVEFFRNRGVSLLMDSYGEAAFLRVGDCFTLSKQLCKAYLSGQFDRICVFYSDFVSVLTQNARMLPLLPLSLTVDNLAEEQEALYEPDPETVMQAIVPEYI